MWIGPFLTSRFSETTRSPHFCFQKNSDAMSDQNPAGSSIDLLCISMYCWGEETRAWEENSLLGKTRSFSSEAMDSPKTTAFNWEILPAPEGSKDMDSTCLRWLDDIVLHRRSLSNGDDLPHPYKSDVIWIKFKTKPQMSFWLIYQNCLNPKPNHHHNHIHQSFYHYCHHWIRLFIHLWEAGRIRDPSDALVFRSWRNKNRSKANILFLLQSDHKKKKRLKLS